LAFDFSGFAGLRQKAVRNAVEKPIDPGDFREAAPLNDSLRRLVAAGMPVARAKALMKQTLAPGMTMAEIEGALRDTRGNRRKAAEMLDIGERTLYRKLRDYGIPTEEVAEAK
jgi:DNA-binding NtrC family response regulator